MEAVIYYFSGTGNTRRIARDLAARIGAELLPISTTLGQPAIRSDARIIGIAFPVYYGDLPNIIRNFAAKLEDIEDKYIFAVANFGGGKGVSTRSLGRIVRSRGGRLAAAYGIQMPQNSWHKPWENRARIQAKYPAAIEAISRNSLAARTVRFSASWLFDLIQIPLQRLFDHLVKDHFRKMTGEPPETSLPQLIRLMDRSFSSDDNCTACGCCARACPVGNISMVDGRPEWLHQCENCLACYNRCPPKAIHTGIMGKDFYYLHPDEGKGRN